MADKKLNPLHEEINKVVPYSIKKLIKDLHVKYAAAPPPPPPPPAAPFTVNVQGGQPMYVNTSDDGLHDIDLNDKVFSDAAMTVPYSDGTYTLDDGTSITIAGGIVTVLTPAAGIPPMDMAQATAQLKAQFVSEKVAFEKTFAAKFASQQKELNEQKATIKDMVELNKTFVAFMDAIVNTPVEDKSKAVVIEFEKELSDDEYKKLSNRDKVRYNKIWK